ncbi:MAG TPA: agmatinase family protein [Blastocatellia bacterium]|jgi:arginase family enzyme|nr:agmatinase family protein [Blastocatellia bacterium]
MQKQIADDPYWPRASAWLAGEFAPSSSGGLAIIGAPLRLGSITPGRCDLAPAAVRGVLRKFSCYDVESDTDLRSIGARDLGDLPLADMKPEDAFEPLRDAVRNALAGAEAVVVIGGDNAVTRPGAHGVADSLERCGLITLDAHFDLRDLSNGLTNGNPVRALLADGLPGKNIVQIGIQPFANSQAYAQMANDSGITVVTMIQIRAHGVERLLTESLDDLSERVEHIYVDLDIDSLDRIFAPATPGSRPGGLTPYELRRAAWLCGAHPLVRAIDLVEVDPTQDVADATVMATASCLLSFASGLLSRS